jgi:hypothetical protein
LVGSLKNSIALSELFIIHANNRSRDLAIRQNLDAERDLPCSSLPDQAGRYVIDRNNLWTLPGSGTAS